MRAGWVVVWLVIVLLVGGVAGYGGYLKGVSAGEARGLSIRNAFLQSRGQANGGAGNRAGAGANANNFAAGQIKQISGNTIELSTAQEVLTVNLTDQTQIEKMATGAASDLQVGERISVQGTRAADGTFTAGVIQIGRGFGPAGGAAPSGG